MMDAWRKAAVLIAALDAETADALLECMGAEQAARVRRAVMQLPEVSPAEQEAVLREFLSSGLSDGLADEGVELDAGLAEKLAGYGAAPVRLPEQPAAPVSNFLHGAQPTRLAGCLARERPATIAAVLARLTTTQAAEVLAQLAPDVQQEVAQQLLELEAADPLVLEELERHLEHVLEGETRGGSSRAPGASLLRAILSQLPAGAQAVIQGRISLADRGEDSLLPGGVGGEPPASRNSLRAERDVTTARRIDPPDAGSPPGTPALPGAAGEPAREMAEDAGMPDARPAFEDLLALSDADFAQVWREVDPEITLLALAGAPPEFMDRIRRRVAPRDARALQKKLTRIGPLRLRDLEEARRHVASQAARLAARGLIRWRS